MADPDVDSRQKRRERFHEADVVIVGAGVLGCAMAFALAEQGRSVLLLERWLHEPDRIVGELMQPGGVAALQKLGLRDCLDGIDAVPCHGYHVVYDGDEVVLPYPVQGPGGRLSFTAEGDKKGGDGKPFGLSFHHGRFITQLRRRCLAHRNITVVETEVTALIRGSHQPDEVLGVEARTAVAAAAIDADKKSGSSAPTAAAAPPPQQALKKPDYFFGQLTIVADGYASRFRADVLGSSPEVRSKFYALELIDCPLTPPGYGHVFLASSAYPVLLYQIGTHETRALIDVPIGLPAAASAAGGVRGYIRNVVLPALPTELQPSLEAALGPDAGGRIPRSMPNSWLPPPPRSALVRAAGQGVVLLGDAYNMRHPLTGGGMTVALNDAVALVALLEPAAVPTLGDHAAVAAAFGRFHWQRKRLTAIINVLAQALYALFAADAYPQRVLRRGCFEYFRRGYAAEPMGLLSGILQRPLVLAYHFFSVAILGIRLHMRDVMLGLDLNAKTTSTTLPSLFNPLTLLLALLRLPFAFLGAIHILWTASVVFLPVFWRELR